jgi:sensor histidine kinase regulating citrate/malate metabolism
MAGAVASVLLNLFIAVLLAVTIGYCWILNRRIKVLQDSKSELAQLLKYFDESTERASESIIALQTASKKIGENIQHRVDKANYLLDDLAFMIEKGSKLADQMEAGFAVSRARARVLGDRQDEINKERQDALVNSIPIMEPQQPVAKPLSAREKTTASLEAALERIAGKHKAQSAAADDDAMETTGRNTGAGRPRSKTEQELLNMLKAGLKG